MVELKDMKIYIVEANSRFATIFRRAFSDVPQVHVRNETLGDFFAAHKDEVDCLVSPANAFGHMTGGYDAALSDILGWDFQARVQDYIKKHFYGEQVVGTSFYVETDFPRLGLIHTPTMRYPSIIRDDEVIYHCMRSTLMCALEHDVTCIVIPFFGGGCGMAIPEVAARRMKDAYMQIRHREFPEDF